MWICTMLKEQPDHAVAATWMDCVVQGGSAQAVGSVQVGAVLDQRTDNSCCLLQLLACATRALTTAHRHSVV
jgi:hypothetical protein